MVVGLLGRITSAPATSAPGRRTSPGTGVLVLGLLSSVLVVVAGTGAGAVLVVDPLLSAGPLAGWRYGHGRAVALALGNLGLALMVIAWVQLGREVYAGWLGRRAVTGIAAAWILPVLLSPPLGSRDVYSYLAQGAVALRGLDPYAMGPAALVGPLLDGVHPMWRSTPAPYGPFSLLLSKAVVAVTGENVAAGVLVMRLVLLGGLGLVCWALPRLAPRLGGSVPLGTWAVLANPVTIVHLVGGVHNELLIIGLVAAAAALVLGGRPVAGTALLTAAVAVKVSAGLALPLVALVWARRREGRRRPLAGAVLGTAATAVATFAALSLAAGVGLGWIGALSVPLLAVTWYSPVAIAAGELHTVVGLVDPDWTWPFLAIARAAALVVLAWVLVAQVRAGRAGGPDAIRRAGVVLLLGAVLAPVVYPWYAAWGAGIVAAGWWSRRGLSVLVGATVLLLAAVRLDGEQVVASLGTTDAASVAYLAVAAVAAVLAAAWLWAPDATRSARAAAVLPGTRLPHEPCRERASGGRRGRRSTADHVADEELHRRDVVPVVHRVADADGHLGELCGARDVALLGGAGQPLDCGPVRDVDRVGVGLGATAQLVAADELQDHQHHQHHYEQAATDEDQRPPR